MIKRILFLVVMAAMLVALVVPTTASADVLGNTVVWTGYAYQGYDSFYGDDVIAYVENTTATVTWVEFNDSGSDITPIEAWLQFDWAGGRYSAASVPATLVDNMPGTFSIAFTVPSAAAAGPTPHGYIFGAAYQRNELDYQALRTKWADPTGDVDGVNDLFTLPGGNLPVVDGSLEVYVRAPNTNNYVLQTLGSQYAFNSWTGVIDFVTPPGYIPAATPQGDVKVNYSHYDRLMPYGDGVRDTWYLANDRTPVVPNSWTFYVKDDNVQTVTALASTAYTFDRFWGQIQLTTPLEPWQQLLARYDWYIRFPWYDSSDVGYTFVVITQDQADYYTAWRRYRETYDTEWFGTYYSGSAIQQMGQAEQLRAQAEIEYREGKFAEAAATMQEAVDAVQGAIGAEAALYGTVETGLTGLLTGAGGVVDAYGNKLQAEADNIEGMTEAQARKLNAEAGMTNTIGVFMILIGVAVILVAIAWIIWAFSRYVEAKGPKQQAG